MSDEKEDGSDDSRPARRKPSSRNSSASSRRSEFDFIEHIRRQELKRLDKHKNSSLITRHSSLLLGIGDDAAVIRQRAGFDTVITADLLVEGIDFHLERFQTRPRDLGHKALAVSLSDVAAMGARPRFCLLSVGVPLARWQSNFLEGCYAGVRALAGRYGIRVIGGDTSRTPEGVVIDSIVVGEVKRGRAVLRSGAKSGDQIFVTGALGGAAAGLKALESRAAPQSRVKLTRAQRRLVLRQVKPEPRVEWGVLLGERRLATALIDLSDGLSSDLAHLCRESGVGARVDAALLPVDPLLKSTDASEADALSLALDGGEDFELLFTVRPRNIAKLPESVGGVRVTRIGEVTGERGEIKIIQDGRERLLKPAGFEHFKRARR
jgi:thiamine-monophosphate kinase